MLSGIRGGEKPHEELPLSVMSSEEFMEAVESGEEIENGEEAEDKSHVVIKRSSAMATALLVISLQQLKVYSLFYAQQTKI